MDKSLLQAARQALLEAQRILIVSHKRPDGDAVGSLLGLGLALQKANKDVQMVLVDGVPSSFRHLTGSDQIRKRPKGEFDITVLVDCSDIQRAGNALEGHPTPTLNIDHHITNLCFASINLVDANATATTEILTEYMPALGLTIDQPIAEALLTGLITDTLGFRTTNMRPQALRVAADLMEIGCDLPVLYRKALLNRSFEAVRYWGAGLSTLQMEDRLLWATLTLEDRKSVNYPGRDDADLINLLASIKGVDIALIFIEQTNGSVKVSWRARSGFDVSKIAFRFGGGGHKPAAGADIEGDLEDIKYEVLEATRTLLNRSAINSQGY